MAATVSELESMIVRLTGDGTGYQRMLQTAQQNTLTFNQTINNAGQASAASFGGGMSSAIGAATVAMGAFAFASRSVSLAADTEMAQTQFSTMLGSVERGKQMLGDLIQFAAETPLQLADTQTAARTLLQFGIAGAEIIPTLTQLGNVTGGDALRFNRMSLAFGQMSSAGRLMGQDLLQMINAGFNPLQEISRTSGVSMAQLKDQMSRGGISVQMVKDAFRSATSEGGMFNNLMLTASRTTSGLFSTMKDDISSVMRSIGFDIIELFHLKDVMAGVSSASKIALDWLRTLSPATKMVAASIIAVVGAGALFVTLWPVLAAVAGPVLAAIGTVLGTILSPIGLVIAGAALIGYAFVQAFGGFSKVWERVKAVFTSASFVETVVGYWEWIKSAATTAWNYITLAVGIFVNVAKPYILRFVDLAVAGWSLLSDGAVAAWNWITEAVSGFVTWMTPIFLASVGIVSAAWDLILEAAVWVWDAVKVVAEEFWEWITTAFDTGVELISSVWSSIFGDSEADWASIKDFIVDMLLMVEFSMRNLGAVFSFIWAKVQFDAVAAFNSISFFFTDTIPALLTYFGTNWTAVFEAMFTSVLTGFEALSFSNLMGLITGDISFDDIAAQVTSGMTGAMQNLPPLTLPVRVPTDLENDLRAEYEAQGDALGGAFAEFRDRRLAEIDEGIALPEFDNEEEALTISPAAVLVAYASGQAAGSSMRRGAAHEIAKFDATSVFGAESASRIRAYMDRIGGMGPNATVIPTQLARPVLPQVDVPGHSLHDLYNLPVIQLMFELVPVDGDEISEVEESLQGITSQGSSDVTGLLGELFRIIPSGNMPSSSELAQSNPFPEQGGLETETGSDYAYDTSFVAARVDDNAENRLTTLFAEAVGFLRQLVDKNTLDVLPAGFDGDD